MVPLRKQLRHTLRRIAIRYPGLERYSGRLGVGRLLAPTATREQITVDGDIVIELDMSVPIFRYIYFHHDLSAMEEILLLRKLLRPEDVVVDVGAHIGVFTLAAAKYGGQVHAFEISPSTTKYLRRNMALNPALAAKVQLHEMGLGDKVGEFTLYNSAGHPGLASLQPIERDDAFSEVVTLTTLDQLLTGTAVAWIKIDVEGSELAVLHGSTEHLAATRPNVLLELFEPFQQRAGTSCAAIEQFFAERDYTGYLMTGSRGGKPALKLVPLQVDSLDPVQVSNALFIPNELATVTVEAIG